MKWAPHRYVRAYAHTRYTADSWPALSFVNDTSLYYLNVLIPGRGEAGQTTGNLYVPTTEELLEWYSP